MNLQPSQQRIVDEMRELSERLQRLDAFIYSDAFKAVPPEEAERLRMQRAAMAVYARILSDRVLAFEKPTIDPG